MKIDYEKYAFPNFEKAIGNMTETEINTFLRLSHMLDKMDYIKTDKAILLYCFGIADGKRQERAKRKNKEVNS